MLVAGQLVFFVEIDFMNKIFILDAEFSRTEHGNNNAYCQDNDVSW